MTNAEIKTKVYKVTVYNITPWGAFIPEVKTFRAMSVEILYDILKVKGYKQYFIGSLLDPTVI